MSIPSYLAQALGMYVTEGWIIQVTELISEIRGALLSAEDPADLIDSIQEILDGWEELVESHK